MKRCSSKVDEKSWRCWETAPEVSSRIFSSYYTVKTPWNYHADAEWSVMPPKWYKVRVPLVLPKLLRVPENDKPFLKRESIIFKTRFVKAWKTNLSVEVLIIFRNFLVLKRKTLIGQKQTLISYAQARSKVKKKEVSHHFLCIYYFQNFVKLKFFNFILFVSRVLVVNFGESKHFSKRNWPETGKKWSFLNSYFVN